jgi:hypothetical protein
MIADAATIPATISLVDALFVFILSFLRDFDIEKVASFTPHSPLLRSRLASGSARLTKLC